MFLPQVTDVLYHQCLIDKINTRNSARVKDVFNSKTEDMSYSKFCNKNNLVVVLQTCFSGSLKTQNVDFQSTKWAHETSDIGSSSITSSLYVIGKMCLRMFVVFRLEFFFV